VGEDNPWALRNKKVNIYVGNLPYGAGDDEIRQLFEAHGAVDSARVIMDRDTGQSKGFAFVEMSNTVAATTAIEALNGHELLGRSLRVNEARPREARGGRRH
jgi:RNA recognition motif-containing protein